MALKPFDPEETRQAILEVLTGIFSTHGQAPEPPYLYVPLRHSQALSPDHGLVAGIRGAGKSVWWTALQSAEHREAIAAAVPSLTLQGVASVSAGFGEANCPDDYPDKRVLRKLLEAGSNPAEIWRTVIAWHTWGRTGALAELGSWSLRVRWLDEHPEESARFFQTYDEHAASFRSLHLVLFDALDRSADDWESLRRLLRGLLEALLEFRAFRAIRAKAFVRPDMLDDPGVTAFRDASKITASKVELRWSRADLYGLLFQRLGNAPIRGEFFRQSCEDLASGRWDETHGIWHVPKRMREDEDLQRRIFDEIAGRWMGRDKRRGFPYTWLPNHLTDAAGQVSPRSFLAAIHTAALHPRGDREERALHYEGIKRGVQEASRIRVDEVKEDFPWVEILAEPLSGLVIPCEFREIESRWESAQVLETLRQRTAEGLLPKHFTEGLAGLRTDLLDLALFSRQPDGRINMPDVYRVGFGLGRMGGVKPIR